jgi:hypothetical protein
MPDQYVMYAEQVDKLFRVIYADYEKNYPGYTGPPLTDTLKEEILKEDVYNILSQVPSTVLKNSTFRGKIQQLGPRS